MNKSALNKRAPNILLIMADQLIPHLTGAYGHPVVRTPAPDRLSREGVVFDSAYSPCPVCAPARAALMTGKYISDIGAWDNAAPFGCDEPTFCHYLTAAGYDTTLAGKMHFIGPDLLRILSEHDLDNTLVIFTSDHGDMLAEKGMVQKRTFYEWSSRVPLIIRFPDGRRAGERSRTPVNLLDIFPTLLEAAGTPREMRTAGDGESLFSILSQGAAGKDRCVFSEYHTQGVHAPCFMARWSRYKYVLIYGHGSQLFDLEEDPGEWRNLSGNPAYSAVENDLRNRILNKFDPDDIDRKAAESIGKRTLIKSAMEKSGTIWYADPAFKHMRKIMSQYMS
jgi:arylsulfatase A-like enzyme